MIRGIHPVAAHTPSMHRLAGFYRDVVGFALIDSGRIAWDANPRRSGRMRCSIIDGEE